MFASKKTWGIVLAGHWNRMIFTPPWVNQNVFHTDESELLITIPSPAVAVYRARQINLEIFSDRLIFRPLKLTDQCLLRAEQMATDTLKILTHTPMIGVGFNFAFFEPKPSEALLDLFNSRDGLALGQAGWETAERRLVRKLTHDERVLNFSLLLEGHQVSFDFNFHKETPDSASAQIAVAEKHLSLRDAALSIMKGVYNLELIPGDDDE